MGFSHRLLDIQTDIGCPLPSILAGTVAGRKDLAELVDEIYSRVWMRSRRVVMVVRASDCQCRSCNSPMDSIPASSDTVESETVFSKVLHYIK
jgi:hypothetical protein